MDAPRTDNEQPELFAHLTDENRRRLAGILGTRVVDAHTAIRGAETQTRLESNIGRTNLNEAFSHVAELAADVDLSPEDQASHLADIEDHLRRAVMEHPERVLRGKIVKVDIRWQEYLLEARSYREKNAMVGVPYHSEMEDDRAKIEALMDEARQMKTQRRPWDATLDVAAKLTEAAGVARALDDKLVQCIGAARELKVEEERKAATDGRARAAETRAENAERRADRAEKRAGLTIKISIVAVAVAVASGIAGLVLTNNDSSSSKPAPAQPTVTQTTP